MRLTNGKGRKWERWIQSSLLENSADAVLQLEVWIRSTADQVSAVVDEVTEFIRHSGCFQGDLRDAELAVREVAANAVVHGNRQDPAKIVRLHCRCAPKEGVTIVVRDEGDGFAPERVRNPLAVENLASAHGRGIHLMRLLMDEVHFEHGGNEVHLRKYAASQPGRPFKYSPSAMTRTGWIGLSRKRECAFRE